MPWPPPSSTPCSARPTAATGTGGSSVSAYRLALGDDAVLCVPVVHAALCTDHILVTDVAPGVPVDRLADSGTQAQRDSVAGALSRLAAGEPLRQAGVHDFGASTLFRRKVDQGQAQFFNQGFARTPPSDLLVLQRKFIGTFMLCTRLRARLDLGAVFGPHL